jgi:hypothetical protein
MAMQNRLEGAQKFEYQPMTEPDGIRLLVLHPAELASADLHCDLVHTTLSLCAFDLIDHYTALSYVWGDANDLRTISVNDRPMGITTNLHSALLHLRDTTRPSRLWVDAVCINQHNDQEKSHQVGMMGKIYAGANHTIIYLVSLRRSRGLFWPKIVGDDASVMVTVVLEKRVGRTLGIVAEALSTGDHSPRFIILSHDPR